MRLESEQRPIEVDGHCKVAKEVAAENAALFEAGSLVYGAKIQNQSAKVRLLKSRQTAFANEKHSHIFRYASRADNARGLVFDYLIAEIQSLNRCR